MENTTNSARQVVDINVRAYRFTELDEVAQERVFIDWRDSDALGGAYNQEVEDIDAAFMSFLDYIDYPTTPDRYGRATGWYREERDLLRGGMQRGQPNRRVLPRAAKRRAGL